MGERTPDVPPEQVWEQGWDGHEWAQRLRMARLPLWEKIAWLEEAQRVVRHLRGEPPLTTGAEAASAVVPDASSDLMPGSEAEAPPGSGA